MKKKTVVYFIAFLILSSMSVVGLFLILSQGNEAEFATSEWEASPEGGHSRDRRDPNSEIADEPASSQAPSDSRDEGDDRAIQSLVSLTKERISQMGIDIRSAGPGQLDERLQVRGKIVLHPDRLAHLLPKVPGVVKEARKNVGEFVKAGEIVAILESREAAEAKADYLAALSKENLSRTLLEKESRLYQKGISPEQDYLQANAIYEEGRIRTHLTRQKLYALGLTEEKIEEMRTQDYPDLRLYELRAPIDGVILERHLTIGEFIESATPIYKIADLNTVWIEMGVYPKDLFKIKKGQAVEAVLPNAERSSFARVIYVSPLIEEENVAARAIAELNNSQGEWCPGTFVKANISLEKTYVSLLVPHEAIQTMDRQSYVFTKHEQGFQKKPVELGRRDARYVEVLAGLDPKELYAANQTFILKAELNKNSIEQED